MKDSVTICIGTVGAPTFRASRKRGKEVASRSREVARIVVIEGERPQSAWLNRMREECSLTKWCLQVDEDMYLKPHALDVLLREARDVERRGHNILNVSSLLYDLFLKE